jgi:hypothetical protein
MPISFQTAGAVAAGTTSAAVPHPTGIVAGNLLLLFCSYKYNDIFATPAGWTKMGAGGIGICGAGPGIDTGAAGIIVFFKIAVGGETGNLTVTNTSGNVLLCRMFRYSYATATKDMALIIGNGEDSAAGSNQWFTALTGWRSANGSVPLTGADVSVAANDVVVAASGINADTYTYTSQVFSMAGITTGTVVERQDSGTASGQDCALVITEHPITAGANSNDSFSYTMTSSSFTANNPCGGTVVVRMREVDKVSSNSLDPFGMMGFFGL